MLPQKFISSGEFQFSGKLCCNFVLFSYSTALKTDGFSIQRLLHNEETGTTEPGLPTEDRLLYRDRVDYRHPLNTDHSSAFLPYGTPGLAVPHYFWSAPMAKDYFPDSTAASSAHPSGVEFTNPCHIYENLPFHSQASTGRQTVSEYYPDSTVGNSRFGHSNPFLDFFLQGYLLLLVLSSKIFKDT